MPLLTDLHRRDAPASLSLSVVFRWKNRRRKLRRFESRFQRDFDSKSAKRLFYESSYHLEFFLLSKFSFFKIDQLKI